jgi:hypothetical protein
MSYPIKTDKKQKKYKFIHINIGNKKKEIFFLKMSWFMRTIGTFFHVIINIIGGFPIISDHFGPLP